MYIHLNYLIKLVAANKILNLKKYHEELCSNLQVNYYSLLTVQNSNTS